MEWRRIKGCYPFEINENGDVRNSNTGNVIKKIYKRKGCYVFIKGGTKSVFKIMYQTFIGDMPSGGVAYCIDGNRENTKLENVGIRQRARAVVRIDKEGIETPYMSIEEASLDNFVTYQAIENCLCGVVATSAGYRWRYLNDVQVYW